MYRGCLGRTGVRALAAIRLRARSTLHRPKRPYAKRSISACASAISGIEPDSVKPSRAGARTVRGVSATACRLAKQFSRARAPRGAQNAGGGLLACDGNSGWCKAASAAVAFEWSDCQKNFASEPMNFRVENCGARCARNFTQRLIERGERGVHLAQLSLKLGETRVEQWKSGGRSLAAEGCQRPSRIKARRPVRDYGAMRAPNTISRWCRIQCKGAGRSLVRFREFPSQKALRLSGAIGPHYLEDCSIGDGVGHRVERVTRLPRTRYRGNLQLSSALDLAERPQSKRQIVHRRDAKVLTEAEPEIAVPFGSQTKRAIAPNVAAHSRNRPRTSSSDRACDAPWRPQPL